MLLHALLLYYVYNYYILYEYMMLKTFGDMRARIYYIIGMPTANTNGIFKSLTDILCILYYIINDR